MKDAVRAKLVFTGDRNQLEKIKKRARATVIVHKIEVEFSDVELVKETEAKDESTLEKKESKKDDSKKSWFKKSRKSKKE